MTNIRRYFGEGQIYFTTHVTFRRMPILVKHADLLSRAVCDIQKREPFRLIAWVILPDHMHLIIDPRGANLSTLIQRIKLSFSSRYRRRVGIRSGRVWQYRFWDHVIRDQADLCRHLDYMHRNPVKHGLVRSPGEYGLSSFRRFRDLGYYDADWMGSGDMSTEFGE